MLEVLKNTPGLKWVPGTPRRFRGMNHEQIKAILMPPQPEKSDYQRVQYYGDAPNSFDWTQQTPECMGVRDQGSCTSCWSFSAVGALSDNRCIVQKDLKRVQYSEQFQISCDQQNQGCNGGWMDKAMEFLAKTGTTTEKCVAYKSGKTGQAGKCPTKCDNGEKLEPLTKSLKFENVCAGEESIKNALTKGVVQTMYIVFADFMYYESGIYHHTSGQVEGIHAVVIVGYGEANGTKFWNVRNSWGEAWGENGYFRILRGVDECQIESECYLLTP